MVKIDKATADNAKRCTRKNNSIRCECGGQVAVGGELRPLVDLGIGFVGGKLRIDRKYSRRVTGYAGFCMACRHNGAFMLSK